MYLCVSFNGLLGWAIELSVASLASLLHKVCTVYISRLAESMPFVQFLAWDTFARRRVDMIGRKDKGDTVIAHEFDYEIEKQVGVPKLKQ